MTTHRSKLSAALLAGVAAILVALISRSTAQRATIDVQRPILQPAVTGFRVDIDGFAQSLGISVHGMQDESEITQSRQGNSNTVNIVPGPHKPGRMELMRDWSNTHEFYLWRKAVVEGNLSYRRNMNIVFTGAGGKEMGRMNFFNCWPTKWKGPELNASNTGHPTEAIEIAFERVELK